MKKSLKAGLLSALVFPGLGHFSLKKPVQGVLFSGMAIICLYFLLSTIIEIAQYISAKILSGEVPMDAARISEMITQQLVEMDGGGINISVLLLVICWVIAIVDSVRIGWQQDKNNKLSQEQS